MNKLSLSISLLLLLALIGSTTALGYVRPEKECVKPSIPVLYLDRWSKRDCGGVSLSLGTTDMRGMDVYGHTLHVPVGYEVIIVKEPLFGVPRVTHYNEGTSRFVGYAFWDSLIIRVEVTRLPEKVEKRDGL